MERDFKGIRIPKEIRLNDEINLMCKILLVEINSLDNEDGCFASNDYFAKFLGISIVQISKYISELKSLGYIEEVGFDGRTRILKSCIVVQLKADINKSFNLPITKVKGSLKQKLKHNNTSNNTNNNIVKIREEFSFYSFVDNFLDMENPQIKYQIGKQGDDYVLKQYAEIDKLIKDGYSIEAIMLVLEFIKQSDFWSKNILSIKKLRDKDKNGIPYIVRMIDEIKKWKQKKQSVAFIPGING